MDPNHFQPWGSPVAQTQAQSTFSLQPPTLTLPNYNLGPGFGSLLQSVGLGSYLGGGAQNSQPAAQPPAHPQPSSSTAGNGIPSDLLSQYTVPWSQPGIPPGSDHDQPQCAICLCELTDNSSYSSDSSYAPVLTLNSCHHSFHSACLTALMSNSPTAFLQCPTCKKMYGIRTGTRPTTGTMNHRRSSRTLPGHTGCGTIELHFMFTPGIQGPEHPSPGHYYTPVGFPRTAFLPDNRDGLAALHGLYLAGEHSYPDDQYLVNLAQDLAGFGVTEAEISGHMR